MLHLSSVLCPLISDFRLLTFELDDFYAFYDFNALPNSLIDQLTNARPNDPTTRLQRSQTNSEFVFLAFSR